MMVDKRLPVTVLENIRMYMILVRKYTFVCVCVYVHSYIVVCVYNWA